MTTIINLSALAETRKNPSIPANLLHYINGNLARQWPSIQAFAKLQNDYAPRSVISSVLDCGLFGMPTYSYGWLLSQIDWNLIAQYKMGQMKTTAFLNELLSVFSFLKQANFSEDIKNTVFSNKEHLVSIKNISSFESLNNEQIALALLEQAWLARMQFSEKTANNITYFFAQTAGEPIYIISNSNEMDCRATIRYLKAISPNLNWLSDKELDSVLEVPDQEVTGGIPLTRDNHLKLYVSYTHQAYKTGRLPETNMTTNNLLKKLVIQEKLETTQTTLISQWHDDCQAAQALGIKNIVDSETYFSAIHSSEEHLKRD